MSAVCLFGVVISFMQLFGNEAVLVALHLPCDVFPDITASSEDDLLRNQRIQ